MASNSFELPVSNLMNKLTLEVRITGMRSHAIRMWVGFGLLKLAGRVIGMGVHIDVDPPA